MRLIRNALKVRNPETNIFESITGFIMKHTGIHVGTEKPSDEEDEVWIDTTLGQETVDIPEINDSEISLVDTWSSEKINERDIYSGDTPPSNPPVNKLWVDTSDSPAVMKRYNGTDWEDISSAGGGGSISYTVVEDLSTLL